MPDVRSRLWTGGASAVRLGWHYVRRTEIEHVTRAGSFLRRIWQLGVAERLVFGVVLALAAVTGVAALPSVPASLHDPLLAVAHLGFFVVAWSVALAAAAASGRPAVLLALAPWLTFYQVLVCGAANGTPVAALPLAWLVGVVLVLTVQVEAWWGRLLSWTLVAAGAGYAGAGTSGLRRTIGWTVRDAQWLLAGILFVLGLGVIWLLRRRASPPRVTFAVALTGAAACMAVAAGFGAYRNWSLSIDWSRTVFDDASAIVVLFWLWTAGSFAASALKLMGWAVRRVGRTIPTPVGLIAGPLAIIVVTAREALSIAAGPMDRLARDALAGHVIAGACAALLAAWWWWRGHLSRSRMILLFTWWLVAWAILNGIHSGGLAVVASRAGTHHAAGMGLLVVAVGLAFELGKMERDWLGASAARAREQLGLVVVAIACAVVLATSPGGGLWESSRTLMVLAGMLHLGVPLALHDAWRRRARKRTGIGTWARVSVFAAGYATALVLLAVEPAHAITLTAGIPVLLGVLLALTRTHPDLSRESGALSGALFGGGLVAGWMMPYPPTVPFLPPPAWVGLLRNWGALGRPPLSMQHLALLVAAWGIGALLGWLVFRWLRRRDAGTGAGRAAGC